jgi:hypothetical protein
MAEQTLALYTATCLIRGQVHDAGAKRLSDYLNDHRFSYLDLTHAVRYELLTEDTVPVDRTSVLIHKEAIQLVIPEDRLNPHSPAWVPTRRVDVELGIGQFSVRGLLHRRLDEPASLVPLLHGDYRRFVAVSGALLRFLPNSALDRTAPVVLVNTRCVDFCELHESSRRTTSPDGTCLQRVS